MITEEICAVPPFAPLRDNCGLNLASRVSWLDVLPMIDEGWASELPNRLLPQEFSCPFCKPDTVATIYAETRDGGEWIHCPGCGFAGDVLEFAGRKLNFSASEAARLLISQGLPIATGTDIEDDLASYAHYIDRRQRINEFWRQAARYTSDRGISDAFEIIEAFQLYPDVSHREWSERGGKYIGVASREDVLQAFYPTRESNREWEVRPLFRGRWHSHVLLLPMYDLPGRLSGFTFLGLRNGKPAYEIRDVYTRAGRSFRQDPGVWMFDMLSAPAQREFPDGEVFFTNGPMDVFWMQLHHVRLYSTPLPLVFIPPAPSRPRAVWNFRRPRKAIFWSRKPDTAFFEQARELDAQVVLLPVDWLSFMKECRELSPAIWLRCTATKAAPWHESFAKTLLGLPSEEVERFWGKLPEGSRNDLFDRLDNRKRSALQHKLPPTLACRTLTYRGQIIAETPQGWQWRPRNGPPQIVLPGQLRVDEIIRNGRRRYLKGRLALVDGRQVAYLVRDHSPNWTKTTKELVDQCERQAELVLHIEPKWRPRIWEIAMAFSTPVVAERRDRVGWDQRRCMLAFPRFAIKANGKLADGYPGLVVTAKTPCRDWEPYETLSKAEISTLSQPGEDVAVVWAVLAVAISNLLAPICNQPRLPLYLYGKGATAALETLIPGLNLPVCTLRADRIDSRRQLSRHTRHDLLTAVLHRRHEHVLELSRLLEPEPLPFVVATQPVHALAAFLRGGHRLEILDSLHAVKLERQTTAKLVINYLESAFKRKLPYDVAAGGFMAALFADLANWWAKLGGQTGSVTLASRRLATSGSEPALKTLVALTSLLRDEPVSHLPATADRPKSVWVSLADLNRLLKRRKAPAVDVPELERRLSSCEGWLGNQTRDGVPGWLFERSQWAAVTK